MVEAAAADDGVRSKSKISRAKRSRTPGRMSPFREGVTFQKCFLSRYSHPFKKETFYRVSQGDRGCDGGHSIFLIVTPFLKPLFFPKPKHPCDFFKRNRLYRTVNPLPYGNQTLPVHTGTGTLLQSSPSTRQASMRDAAKCCDD